MIPILNINLECLQATSQSNFKPFAIAPRCGGTVVERLLQIAQVVVLGPSLFFVGYQVLLQRRQVHDQVAIEGYKLYHLLDQQYVALLLRSDHDPKLDQIWQPPDADRTRVLNKAQRSGLWGAWYAMNSDERRCYRLIRAALETFEQTYQLRQKGWIDEETWHKWEEWVQLWRNVRYFDYVFEDTSPRLIRTFTTMLMAAEQSH
jgi:hypothetical protein